MAHLNLELINSTFCFAGNNVVAKANSLGFTDKSIFRQVVFQVDTYYNQLESQNRRFVFTVNAENYIMLPDDAFEVSCDISSALRSALAKHEYDPGSISNGAEVVYPMVSFKITVFTKELIDGRIKESDKTKSGIYKAYAGRLSDYECWKSETGINCSPIPSFTTKPSGEVYGAGQLGSVSSFDDDTDRVKSLFFTHDGEVDNRQRTTILFVNSRGVYETISIVSNESEEYDIDTEVRSLVGVTSYRPSPSIISHKEGGVAVWKMSSGYVNKDWAQWYAREFLMAKHYWLRKDGLWLPVAITPDSGSVMTYDKNDPSLVAVNFTVMAAIKG